MQRIVARIIDANLNRAREAMRVLEDFARFMADDTATSKTLKQMRHDLAAAARTWPIADLLAARDTPGDVGTRITTDGEKRRQSVADIVTAAAKRLTEALRVLEEYAKLDDANTAAAIERIRYQAYSVEKRIVPIARTTEPRAQASGPGRASGPTEPRAQASGPGRASGPTEPRAQASGPGRASGPTEPGAQATGRSLPPLIRGGWGGKPTFADVRLYVLITESLCRKPWLQTAREAIAGGADCLQLREKDLDDGELLTRARQLADLCHRHGVLCFINDRPDIARLAGADGVHLGQTDMPVAAAREVAGPALLIGKSTHNVAQFRRALREGPDYLAIGPMYDTTTKPQRHIPGPGILPSLRKLCAAGRSSAHGVAVVPIVAIGGITADGLAPIVAAGCSTVAVCAAVIGAENPKRAAATLKRRMKKTPQQNAQRKQAPKQNTKRKRAP